MPKPFDRVQAQTASSGTGTLTLGSAALGYDAFSVIPDGTDVFYTIEQGSKWEIGKGVYAAGALTRPVDQVRRSSNSGGLVDFAIGAFVWVDRPALPEILTPQHHNAKGDGVVDDTDAFARALDELNTLGGGVLWVPKGTYRIGPVVVGANIMVQFAPGAVVVPIFDPNVLEKLFLLAGDGAAIDGLRVSGVSGTLTQNHYIVYAQGCNGPRVTRCDLRNINASDGYVGLGPPENIIVTHGVYIDNCTDAVVEDNYIDTISGSAVFLKFADRFAVRRNTIKETRWYSITADKACYGGEISSNRISGVGVNCRLFGGSINLMSQTDGGGLGLPNHHIWVHHNEITGVHNYGAAIRVLSLSDSTIEDNFIHDVTSGALLGDPVTYIAIDRRGTVIGADENGPCRRLVIANNVLVAGSGTHHGIQISNQFKATRDPHEQITIANNIVKSISASACFNQGVTANGHQCGVEGLVVSGNQVSVYQSGTSAPTPGGIGIASTNVNGEVDGLDIADNRVVGIESTFATSADSARIGIFLQSYCGRLRVQGNHVQNFLYGLRLGVGLNDVEGGYDNTFTRCATNLLLGSPVTKGPADTSAGTALPTSGVFSAGHRRTNTLVSGYGSPGWVVTTGGAAYTDVWAAGQTYVAGAWYRGLTATTRVYELVTAGGGPTSAEPTHTTLGQEVTGGDGYTWRLRSLTSVAWVTENSGHLEDNSTDQQLTSIIKNTNPGASSAAAVQVIADDAYATLLARSIAGGHIVNLQASNNVGLSIVQLANAPLDLWTNSVFRERVAAGGGKLITDDGLVSNPNAAALLELKSTTKGFLLPRMTTTQRLAITSPPVGLMVYDTTVDALFVRKSAAWAQVTTS